MPRHPIMIAAFILGAFAVAGTSLVAFTHEFTKERIAANERETLLKSLFALVPADAVDNDMSRDTLSLDNRELLGGENITVYIGRKGGQPVAAVFNTIVPDGYSGPIKLLVAINHDGSLGGVRVVSHKETPGLGDKIEEDRSDWVLGFAGKSLTNPPLDKWKVKRDGGVFDQFTGATITPRSIVNAVKHTLLYESEHRAALYARKQAHEHAVKGG